MKKNLGIKTKVNYSTIQVSGLWLFGHSVSVLGWLAGWQRGEIITIHNPWQSSLSIVLLSRQRPICHDTELADMHTGGVFILLLFFLQGGV